VILVVYVGGWAGITLFGVLWFHAALVWHSGWAAARCGTVAKQTDRSRALACVAEARASGRPFRVAFHEQGIDSSPMTGLARRGDGTQVVVEYDSSVFGGCPAPLVEVPPCESPALSALPSERAIECKVL